MQIRRRDLRHLWIDLFANEHAAEPCPIAARTSAGESANRPWLRLRMRCCNWRSPSTDRFTESRFGAPSRVFASNALILGMGRY
jgi:hypothetical protein